MCVNWSIYASRLGLDHMTAKAQRKLQQCISNWVGISSIAKSTQPLVQISQDLSKAIFPPELGISPQVEIRILQKDQTWKDLSLVFWPPEMVAKTSIFVRPNTGNRYSLSILFAQRCQLLRKWAFAQLGKVGQTYESFGLGLA